MTFHIGRFGVPVIAEFTAPEPRTIVMRIVDGEGTGSVVETHATPVGPGPTGTRGHRGRRSPTPIGPGSRAPAAVAPLITPFMRYAATRLWRDDLAYAERRYQVRTSR